MSDTCGMLSHFLRGKTHDVYGLLLMVATNFYLLFSTASKTHELLAVIDLMTSTGIMADLWAHCFHH
jgi:hypothetical protein